MNFLMRFQVNRWIAAFTVVFVIFHFGLLFFDTTSDRLISWFGFPTSLSIGLEHPWSIVTHFFIHVSLGHLLLNAMVLYSLGHRVEEEMGGRYVNQLILAGALMGLVCYVLSGFLQDGHDRFLVGSSAGAMAVMGALLAIQPKRKVSFFGVVIIEVTWLVIFVVLIDLIGIRQGWNVGGHLAHWGGLLMGYAFAKSVGSKEGVKKKGNTIVHRRPKTDDEFNEERIIKERRLNAILDKINRSGFDSLTLSEKEFLKEQSK